MSVIEEAVGKIDDWMGKTISIWPLFGGLTNSNYKVEVDGMPYFVCAPGESTDLLGIDITNHLTCLPVYVFTCLPTPQVSP